METVNIEELVQDQHNFNKGTEEGARLMEKSFTELGAGRSILIDKDGHIIAGNKSQKAAMAAGIKKVRVIESDGTELIAVKRTDISIDSKEGRELALADNLTTQVNLAWDNVELASVAAEQGIDLPDWGLDPKDLGIEDPTETKEAQEDDFDEEKDKVETVCKKGDIWQLGNHRLMCGDSTKPEDIAALMAGERADIWLTDPPYNVDYVGKTKDALKINNDKMSPEQFREFLNSAFKAAFDVLVDGGAFYIWFASREYVNFELALREAGLQVRQELIWNKNSLVMGRQDYQWKHEPCLYGWKDGAAHRWYSDRSQTTVIDWKRPTKSEEHPTMKPVGLFGYQIGNSSKKGDVVLDTFGGSGTTIIACEQLNRKARSMELDPHYCDVIIARWEKLTGKKATLINNN